MNSEPGSRNPGGGEKASPQGPLSGIECSSVQAMFRGEQDELLTDEGLNLITDHIETCKGCQTVLDALCPETHASEEVSWLRALMGSREAPATSQPDGLLARLEFEILALLKAMQEVHDDADPQRQGCRADANTTAERRSDRRPAQ